MADRQPSIGTVGTSFEIIEGLDELGGAGVTELARHLDRSKSSVYKHLDSLLELGYVTKRDGTYELGLAFFRLGRGVRESNELYDAARDPVDNLARTTGETVSLYVEERGDAVCLYLAGGPSRADAIEEAGRVPLRSIPAGKAILAGRSTSEAIELLERGAGDGRQTLSDLEPDLGSVRERRLLVERRPDGADYNAVAVPVRDDEEYAVGAIMVSGPPTSLTGKRLEEDVAGLLVSTAKNVEVALASG